MSIYLAACGIGSLLAATPLAAASPRPAAVAASAPLRDVPDWIVEDAAGVLSVRLAHAESTRPDGGTLVVDPNRRLLRWEGAPGENGCRRALEVPFARVRGVRLEPQGVLRLELRGEPRDPWLFVPLPDAAWLARTSSAVVRGFLPGMRETFISGPRDDAPMPASGSAAFMGAQLRPDLVPAEVSADLRLAVERLRGALGRRAVPSAAVYEALHGVPLEVSVEELSASPALLEGRAVRVRGVAEPLAGRGGIALVDGDARVRVVPEPEIAALVRATSRGWAGEEIEVAGVVRRTGDVAGTPGHEVVFWQYEGPDAGPAPDDVRAVSLRDVVERADELVGQTVRVVGKFRGRNLFRDLDDAGPRGAWVLKAKRHAVWVTGHGPSGRGFRLNPRLERDTTRWLEVVGTVERRDGHPVLRARTVGLAAPATFVWNGPRLRPDPRPEVVFTLPLADEEVAAGDARLLVQFSAYMDEESFEGHVRVRIGAGGAPDRDARRARWTYDDVRRVLVVDPGEPLRGGATVEVALLRGIADVYAAPFEPRPGSGPDDPAQVLRWHVAPGPAADATR